jgi:chromosome segregation ATPase
MAKINENAFRDWHNGDKVNEYDYEREREIIRIAINDNYDRIIARYDKTEVDTLVNGLKGEGWVSSITLKSLYDIVQEILGNRYTKQEVDSLISNLQNQVSSNDSELRALDERTDNLENKTDTLESRSSELESKTDSLDASKADKEDTYTKQEVNAMATLATTEIIDGGTFLDTYSSQSAKIDGGEF